MVAEIVEMRVGWKFAEASYQRQLHREHCDVILLGPELGGAGQ